MTISRANGGLPLIDDTTFIQIDISRSIKRKNTFSCKEEWNTYRKKIRKELKAMDYRTDKLEKISIALDEMCINAFIHGNKGDPAKTVSVKTEIDFSSAVFIIEDQRAGFNPEKVPDPSSRIEDLIEMDNEKELTHGRGIWIAEKFMDEFSYSKNGTCVRLVKKKKSGKVRFS